MQLTILCGLKSYAKCLTLEKLAHNGGYNYYDEEDCLPPNNECIPGGPNEIWNSLDLDKVAESINQDSSLVPVELSEDAGRYLCEYTYYTGIYQDPHTIFVHVPPLNNPYSLEDLTKTLRQIAIACLKSIKTPSAKSKNTKSKYLMSLNLPEFGDIHLLLYADDIAIIGFEPFRKMPTNPSWQVVEILGKEGVDDSIKLVTQEVPVCYAKVSSILPQLLEQHKPQVVVLCGFSHMATTLVLEKVAHNQGYCTKDSEGCLPPDGECCHNGDCKLCSPLDLNMVADSINQDSSLVPVILSQDAGRYLCEFIYYTVLKQGYPAVFVHVPPLDGPYSLEALAKTLRKIVQACVRSVKSPTS
ncbi:PGPEP1 [Cordylochernes scorpioides]|uniref:PGPEP1 n=1 Tax=Cordylochernes scorpioides TaxID=51811 RepID=A0ABY6K0T3_9ARAC|nr:PGPEP1 [Cordylochernes scorpioides]